MEMGWTGPAESGKLGNPRGYMKSQVLFHLETGITHLKQVHLRADRTEGSAGYTGGECEEVADYLSQKSEPQTDWGDSEFEAQLCKALAEVFSSDEDVAEGRKSSGS